MATFVPIRGTQAQINATPIVDGQMLIETDQGNFNKIYLDVNTTRYQVGGHSGGTGSTLVVTTSEPTLYGKSVSVVIDGTTYTGTFNASGTVVIDSIVKVGNATVTSTDGTDTATNYVAMPYYGLYTIALSFFSATVTVTFPHSLGAVCTLSDGTATLVATTSPMNFVVGNAGTWEATVTLDGIDKTDSVQITADGQTKSMTIEYGTINLTVDADFVTASSTITCVQGGTTISKTALSTSMTFYPPTTGNWTISGVIGADTFYSSPNPVNVANLGTPVSADLQTLPNGQTVTPTDNVQLWLNCAGIYDKTTYTTLADVLADDETLQKLINDHNACDYLKRSTSWIKGGLVPTMTSNTTPSGEASGSGVYSGNDYYKAFDGDDSTYWYTTATSGNVNYEFPNSTTVTGAYIKWTSAASTDFNSMIIKGYDTSTSSWVDLGSVSDTHASTAGTFEATVTFSSPANYSKYGLFGTTVSGHYLGQVITLQFYEMPIVGGVLPKGITEDSNAMQYIGLRDYAANTLLSDVDWLESIANSEYVDSVLNVSVPIMTSNTTPSGEVTAISDYGSTYAIWKTFNPTLTQGGMTTNTGGLAVGDWIAYEFTSAVEIYLAQEWTNGAGHTFTGKIQAFDGTNWVDVSSAYSHTSDGNKTPTNMFVNTNGIKYHKYRFLDTVAVGGNLGSYVGLKLQFYGREDIGTDYVYVASAADDTITATPQGGGSAITITTDNSGVANVLPSNLPSGSYTFTSSVANDPDNIGNYYSDSININVNDTILIKLMPDNVLYWYGYKSDDLEECTNANGWGTYYNSGSPVYNTNSIRIIECGVGSINPINPTNGNAYIIKETTQVYSNTSIYVSWGTTKIRALQLSDKKQTDGIINTREKLSITGISEGYLCSCAQDIRGGDLYALWYD